MLFKFTTIVLSVLLAVYSVQAFPGNWGRRNYRRNYYRSPRCKEPRTNSRLGMCYQDFEQPQIDKDALSVIDPPAANDGHNFFVYGNGTDEKRFVASHISTLLVHPHIYSTTVEIEFLEESCSNLVHDILRQIEDQTRNLLLKYNQETSKIAELVQRETILTIIVVPSFTTADIPAATSCQAKFTKVYDLRRYHFNDQTSPQPEFPEFANWLIFSNEEHRRHKRSAYDEDDYDDEREIHYYMERLPTKCKDIHQMLEVFPNCDSHSRERLDRMLNNGRQAAVIQLKEISGEPSLDANDIPIDSVIDNQMQVYNAVSLEDYRKNKKVNFKLLVKRKVITDTDIINIFC